MINPELLDPDVLKALAEGALAEAETASEEAKAYRKELTKAWCPKCRFRFPLENGLLGLHPLPSPENDVLATCPGSGLSPFTPETRLTIFARGILALLLLPEERAVLDAIRAEAAEHTDSTEDHTNTVINSLKKAYRAAARKS